MIVPCFVDTSVLVYAEDGHDPRKQALARDLIRNALRVRTATVSTQVLAESFAVAVGRLRLTPESARRRVEIYCSLNVFRIGSEDILAAYRADHDWEAYTARFAPLLTAQVVEVGREILGRYRAPCLLCAELGPEHCHRGLVAAYWATHIPELTVVHL